MIDVNVLPSEYHRLLGYPPGFEVTERAAELEAKARAWFAAHGRPWIHTQEISLGVLTFTGARLRKALEQAEAHAAILVAVSAGPELEQEAQRLWKDDKPDEYFFLEVLGSAIVEHLTTTTGARLCAQAERAGMAVLPHDSPGYPGWDISEQPRLFSLFAEKLPIEVLDSGALRPNKSLLGVFGLTRHIDRVRSLTELNPCENCVFHPCQYRRMPYRRVTPAYSVNDKALKRWASERLTLAPRSDGRIDALFRYEGTTCTNMGRSLSFDYRVKLGAPSDGYPILEQSCGPSTGDTGHKSMCGYLDHGPQLMASIENEKPLLGERLERVLGWKRPPAFAGCYCQEDSRQHKWGLVLETIHYALTKRL
jgi:hypothetical protein